MSEPITIPKSYADDGSPCFRITDDHMRAIHARMVDLGLLPSEPESVNDLLTRDANATPAPASPVDDEATVQAMRREIAPYSDEWENIATDLIAAIRRGEVPGIPSPHEHAALKAEVERLRAEVEHWKNAHAGVVSAEKAVFADAERLRQELQSIRGRAASAMHDICGMGSDPTVTDPVETLIAYAAQWYADRRELQAERDAAIARAENAEKALDLACQTRNAAVDAATIVCKERDQLLARLEEKTKEHGSDSMKLSIVIEKLEAELASAIARAEAAEVRLAMQSHDYETARAAHAEAMELLREADTDHLTGCRFCDTGGKLRKPARPGKVITHDDDCWYVRKNAHLAKHGGGK